VATGRTVAGQIDSALRSGVSMERTKALDLVPHLVNVLRELGATPAARTQVKGKAAEVAAAEPPVGELGKLRALVGGRGKPQT
jgi:hypothetical protein